MSLTFGSAQVNGMPLIVTALTQGTAQLLHTAPAGAATPALIRLNAVNIDPGTGTPGVTPTSVPPKEHTLFIQIADSGSVVKEVFQVSVPLQSGLFPVLDGGQMLVLNGADTVKVWGDAASVLLVSAVVDDQSSVAGAVSQTIGSGLIAAVQNASRFGVSANGGTGQAAVANGSVAVSRAGIIRNLGAKVDGAVGGGATITVSVFKNGITTAQSLTLANADGTAWKQTAGAAISVVAGDLISFSIATDNAGAPAANVSAAIEFV